MKILFDNQIFRAQRYGGISRYFSNIIKEAEKNHYFDSTLPFLFNDNRHLIEAGLNKRMISLNLNSKKFKGKYKLIELTHSIDSRIEIKALKQNNFDVFHPTYYTPISLPSAKPMVLTVHDLIHELFPHFFKNSKKVIEQKKNLINRADHIIAVSENTKSDLINLYKVEEHKISVIYHASSLANVLKESINIHDDYCLYVGSRNGYKNFITLLNAYMKYSKNYSDILICAGGGEFNNVEIKLLRDMGLEHKVKQINLSDGQLKYLYENATCLIYPSIYEGFGIPILEAFSLGCPVICSNIKVFNEVARNNVIYFNPNDQDEILGALFKIKENKGLRKQLIEKGREMDKQYSWKTAAQLTQKVYVNLIQ